MQGSSCLAYWSKLLNKPKGKEIPRHESAHPMETPPVQRCAGSVSYTHLDVYKRQILGNGGYVHDHLTGFLEEVKERAKFHYWLFGHYHDNKIIDDRFVLLWEQMVQVV